MQLALTIVSPEKTLFDGNVKSVQVPGVLGRFEILENHAPIISSLNPGVIVYNTGSETNSLFIKSGFVEVEKNKVMICVELK